MTDNDGGPAIAMSRLQLLEALAMHALILVDVTQRDPEDFTPASHVAIVARRYASEMLLAERKKLT